MVVFIFLISKKKPPRKTGGFFSSICILDISIHHPPVHLQGVL